MHVKNPVHGRGGAGGLERATAMVPSKAGSGRLAERRPLCLQDHPDEGHDNDRERSERGEQILQHDLFS
jgi:hypothetical protein